MKTTNRGAHSAVINVQCLIRTQRLITEAVTLLDHESVIGP